MSKPFRNDFRVNSGPLFLCPCLNVVVECLYNSAIKFTGAIMRFSDIRNRLNNEVNKRNQQEQAVKQNLKQYFKNDPSINLFRTKYLSLFQSTVKDCGRQLGKIIEKRTPDENCIGCLSFKVPNNFFSRFTGSGLYSDNFIFGKAYKHENYQTGSMVIEHRFHALIHVPLGSDTASASLSFEDIPCDLGEAQECLNNFLFRRFEWMKYHR